MTRLDFRTALRSLRLSPTFTVTAVATLALGIGATTAIFSMVDAVLLQPLPYHTPERLVRIWESKPSEGKERFDVATANFVDWQMGAQSFDGLALFDTDSNRTVLGTPAGSIQIRNASVTPNLFTLLGVQPQVGRSFTTAADAGSDSLREVVISHQLWRTAFATDPGIIGTTVRIEGRSSFVIVGVMPPAFSFPGDTELWFATTKQQLAGRSRDARFSAVVGRLKDGVALATARADLETIAHQLARDYSATNSGWTVAVAPLQDALVGNARLALVTLFGAVTLVLLIACANVANLLLARGAARHRELAIRAALGASRRRLVQQLLTESLVLSLAGGAIGWLLATATLPVLWRLAGDTIPRIIEAHVSGAALGFCVLLSVGTTFVIGLVPALEASRLDFNETIQGDGERTVGAPGRSRLQQLFVITQVAVALVLVVGAVLLIQSVVQLRRVDLGFKPDHVIGIDVRVPFFGVQTPDRWFRLAETSRTLVTRLRRVPGVEAIATTSDPPLSGNALTTIVTIRQGSPVADQGASDTRNRRMVLYHRVSPGYFMTVGMPLIVGRDFHDDDASNESQLVSPRATPRDGAVIVNETMARRFWPNGNALGQYLSTSFDRRTTSGRRIVGVVRDAKSETLRAPAAPEVYVPYLEDPAFAFTLLVRTTLPLSAVAATLRREMSEVDSEVSTANLRMLNDIVTESMGSSRFNSLVVGMFATAALMLAAVGIYGVLAFGVSRRTREIGIRVALGATSSDIRRLFLGQTMKAVCIGVTLGLGGAFAVTRLISNLLFGIQGTDPLSFAGAVLMLVAVALAASYLPVRRAMRMQPVTALRS
jgi:putative ABC transport system permease protein